MATLIFTHEDRGRKGERKKQNSAKELLILIPFVKDKNKDKDPAVVLVVVGTFSKRLWLTIECDSST